MTDHYTETNRLIDGLHNLEGHNADFDMALAQVHATLELANQQRIANLIALYGLADTHWDLGVTDALFTHEDGAPKANPEIARTLRIETP